MESPQSKSGTPKRELNSLPEEFSSFTLGKQINYYEYHMILEGYEPEIMDDKWIIFVKDNWIHFYRSWSNNCIYVSKIEPYENGYLLGLTLVNRNREQYKARDDGYDKKLIAYLVDRLLLSKAVEFPKLTHKTKTDMEAFKYNVVGRGWSNTEIKKTKSNLGFGTPMPN